MRSHLGRMGTMDSRSIQHRHGQRRSFNAPKGKGIDLESLQSSRILPTSGGGSSADMKGKFLESLPRNLYRKGAQVNRGAPKALSFDRSFEVQENAGLSSPANPPNAYLTNPMLRQLMVSSLRNVPMKAQTQDILMGELGSGISTSEFNPMISPQLLNSAGRSVSAGLHKVAKRNRNSNMKITGGSKRRLRTEDIDDIFSEPRAKRRRERPGPGPGPVPVPVADGGDDDVKMQSSPSFSQQAQGLLGKVGNFIGQKFRPTSKPQNLLSLQGEEKRPQLQGPVEQKHGPLAPAIMGPRPRPRRPFKLNLPTPSQAVDEEKKQVAIFQGPGAQALEPTGGGGLFSGLGKISKLLGQGEGMHAITGKNLNTDWHQTFLSDPSAQPVISPGGPTGQNAGDLAVQALEDRQQQSSGGKMPKIKFGTVGRDRPGNPMGMSQAAKMVWNQMGVHKSVKIAPWVQILPDDIGELLPPLTVPQIVDGRIPSQQLVPFGQAQPSQVTHPMDEFDDEKKSGKITRPTSIKQKSDDFLEEGVKDRVNKAKERVAKAREARADRERKKHVAKQKQIEDDNEAKQKQIENSKLSSMLQLQQRDAPFDQGVTLHPQSGPRANKRLNLKDQFHVKGKLKSQETRIAISKGRSERNRKPFFTVANGMKLANHAKDLIEFVGAGAAGVAEEPLVMASILGADFSQVASDIAGRLEGPKDNTLAIDADNVPLRLMGPEDEVKEPSTMMTDVTSGDRNKSAMAKMTVFIQALRNNKDGIVQVFDKSRELGATASKAFRLWKKIQAERREGEPASLLSLLNDFLKLQESWKQERELEERRPAAIPLD